MPKNIYKTPPIISHRRGKSLKTYSLEQNFEGTYDRKGIQSRSLMIFSQCFGSKALQVGNKKIRKRECARLLNSGISWSCKRHQSRVLFPVQFLYLIIESVRGRKSTGSQAHSQLELWARELR